MCRVRKAPELRQSLRVPIEKLDRLAHLAPEMVVQSLKAFERHTELRRLERMLSRLRDRVREARLTPDTTDLDRGAQLADYADALDSVTRRMREFLVSFSDDRVRLNLITEELRQNVIELTMLPVASVFDAFPRAVRDLARTFGKEIEITIRGRETELDKKIIEQISEPLIHLMRNAVDHGIETPADRVRIGKPAAGHLILSAEQQGNRILITLKDDGCGIDLEMLRAVAIQRRVAAASDIDRWSPEQLLDLIFQPGFSTRSLDDRRLRPRRRHGRRQERRRAPRRHRARPVGARQGHEHHAEPSAVARAAARRAARGRRRAVRAADRRHPPHSSG